MKSLTCSPGDDQLRSSSSSTPFQMNQPPTGSLIRSQHLGWKTNKNCHPSDGEPKRFHEFPVRDDEYEFQPVSAPNGNKLHKNHETTPHQKPSIDEDREVVVLVFPSLRQTSHLEDRPNPL